MKSTHSTLVTCVALLVFGAIAPGCAVSPADQTGQADVSASASQSLIAGEQARTRFGIEQYVVQLNPDQDGNHVSVDLKGEDGKQIGNIIAYHEVNGGRVFRITLDGAVTELRADAERMSVSRDGIVRYTLDRAQVDASNALSQLEAKATPMTADDTRAVGLAATVASDKALIDYVASVSPGDVPYLVKDCPWWVTLAACVGWETGVGAVMCVACGASYLL